MVDKTDWTSFRKRIFINKPVEEIYSAWATQSKIEQWFLEKAIYTSPEGKERKSDEPIEKGDSFTWKWNNWDIEEKGNIIDANGKDSLSFTFGTGGFVYIKLKSTDKGIEVLLVQDGIPVDERSKHDIFVGCSTGWTFWLANLKAWLEHGITLHEKGLKQEDTADLVNS